MSSMFEWLNYNRPDVVWLMGPNVHGECAWDESLPNQQEIMDILDSYDPEWVNPNNIPASVSPRQLRTALVLSGYTMSQIESIISSMPEPNKSLASIAWEYSSVYERSNPLVNQLGGALGLSQSEIDGIWKTAATL